MLLEHGADVNTPGSDRSTPLHTAVRWADIKVVRVLLEHGADINAPGSGRSTPLHVVAALYGYVEVVRMLLEHGASTSVKDICGKTPLMVAWSSDIIELLLKHGAK